MKMIAKTFFGLETVLANELKGLGAQAVQELNRAVEFEGDQRLLYSANLWLRTALRILVPIHEFHAHNDRHLYQQVQKVDWSEHLSPSQSFAIDSTVHSDRFTHSKYVALKTKDAIVDQIREKTGKRPSIDTEHPDMRIHLHIAQQQCTISLDSSGEVLHKRGYRQYTNDAPINEVLAAGILLMSGWNKRLPLTDPMCGSGTICIEAALMARNIAPGSQREFAFQKWANYDSVMFDKIKAEAAEEAVESMAMIRGSDKDRQAVRYAEMNAEKAGVAADIQFERKDFFKTEALGPKGLIVTNPPYGERMEGDMVALYSAIGDHLKHEFEGHSAWIISSDIKALKRVGLRPSQKIKLFNGALECRLHAFDLFGGKRADKLEAEHS